MSSRKQLGKRIEDLGKQIDVALAWLDLDIPADPVEFFKTVLHIEPYPYQAEFLQDPSPLKVLRWCRRAGKTTVMSGSDIHFAAFHPGAVIIITMPKFGQIKEIYFQGEAGLHAHLARMDDKVYDVLIEEELQTIIRFRNKAIIIPETPEPFTIRGHGPQKINVDEMNFIRRDDELWLSALLPMTLTRTVYINVASTPWNKDSIYYRMCFDKHFRTFSGNKHEHDPPRYLKIWSDVLQPYGPLDPKQVDVMREQYAGDPWRWKREMECAFVDDETAFLPSSLIIKCQNEELEFAKFEDNLAGDFYVGWDLGRERDPAAVAVIDLKGDVRQLVHCKQFPLKTPHVTVMAYIKSVCSRWRHVNAVYYDHTGTMGMDEQIERVGFPNVCGVDFTKPKKHGMATALKQLMMTPRKTDEKIQPEEARRKFELPFDKDVQAELNVEQWEQTPGSEVYTFSHPEGSHDDRFWAICLAVMATIKHEAEGAPDAFIFL
jgi:phage FluMu gp28-like protein